MSVKQNRASGKAGRESMALVREVRENGFECESRDGHVWLVWRKGEAKVLAKFGRHPKNEGVVRQARQDLREKGIIEGVGARKGIRKPKKKEGEQMPVVTDELKKETEALVPRLREYLESQGGDSQATRKALAQRAVQVIAFRHENGLDDVEQFGSTGQGRSEPWAIAVESLRGLLDMGRSGTEKSNLRWSTVLDEIDRQSGNGAVALDVSSEEIAADVAERASLGPVAAARAAAEEETEPIDIPDDVSEKLVALEERAKLAESVVEEVEAERDSAREELVSAQQQLATADATIAKLREQTRTRDDGVSIRDQYVEILIERLRTAEDTPGDWLLDRLDRLAGLEIE